MARYNEERCLFVLQLGRFSCRLSMSFQFLVTNRVEFAKFSETMSQIMGRLNRPLRQCHRSCHRAFAAQGFQEFRRPSGARRRLRVPVDTRAFECRADRNEKAVIGQIPCCTTNNLQHQQKQQKLTLQFPQIVDNAWDSFSWCIPFSFPAASSCFRQKIDEMCSNGMHKNQNIIPVEGTTTAERERGGLAVGTFFEGFLSGCTSPESSDPKPAVEEPAYILLNGLHSLLPTR